MRLSLLRAKEALKNKAPADKLEWRINRLHERVLLNGKFLGSVVRLALIARYGQLTPPRFIKSIHGVRYANGCVPEIANRWFDFLPRLSLSANGDCLCPAGFSLGLIHDVGDDQPIINDLPADGTLTLSAGPGILTIYGYDADFAPITQQLLGGGSVANPFTSISRIHKEYTAASYTLTHVAADTTQTILAVMEPNEEETCYHRYRIDDKATTAETTMDAICKLRHIEFTKDTDMLYVSNLSALELGMDALQYEAENDHTTADRYLAKCIDLLNKDLQDSNSDHAIPTIRFHYVGGAPNFTHGY